MRTVVTVSICALITACAAPSLYNWGGYDQALYAGYKDSAKMDELRVKLESHINAMESTQQKIAPGLYAELGTLYLQAGSKAKAVDLYKRERQAWPESTVLMTSLIENLERQSPRAGATQ